jgi:hypothetical protein
LWWSKAFTWNHIKFFFFFFLVLSLLFLYFAEGIR